MMPAVTDQEMKALFNEYSPVSFMACYSITKEYTSVQILQNMQKW